MKIKIASKFFDKKSDFSKLSTPSRKLGPRPKLDKTDDETSDS